MHLFKLSTWRKESELIDSLLQFVQVSRSFCCGIISHYPPPFLNYQISDEIKVVSLAFLSIFRSLLLIQRGRRFLRAHSVMDRSGTLSPIASAVEHLIQAFHRIHFMATNNEAQHQLDPINSEYTCTRTRTEHTRWLSRTCTDI